VAGLLNANVLTLASEPDKAPARSRGTGNYQRNPRAYRDELLPQSPNGNTDNIDSAPEQGRARRDCQQHCAMTPPSSHDINGYPQRAVILGQHLRSDRDAAARDQ